MKKPEAIHIADALDGNVRALMARKTNGVAIGAMEKAACHLRRLQSEKERLTEEVDRLRHELVAANSNDEDDYDEFGPETHW